VQLQTGLKGNRGKLSELGTTSDRFRGNQRKAVRTWCSFRQVWGGIRAKLSELEGVSDILKEYANRKECCDFKKLNPPAVRLRGNFMERMLI